MLTIQFSGQYLEGMSGTVIAVIQSLDNLEPDAVVDLAEYDMTLLIERVPRDRRRRPRRVRPRTRRLPARALE